METMDYRYLKAFLLTAEHSSFSKAAELLKIAQSAVSRQIKLLEESVGEELIIRSSKKVLLTAKGQQLYLAAKSFDRQSMDIFQKEDARALKIGVLHGLLESWLTPVLTKFYKKYDRNIDIHISVQPLLRQDIEQGLFDVIFTTDNIQSEIVSSRQLFEERMVLISKKEVNKKKLHEKRWIVYGDGDFMYKLSETKSPQIIRVDSITTIVNLVKQDVGVAVVPDHVIKKTDNLIVTELPEFKASNIYMATLNYKVLPRYINELFGVIKDLTDNAQNDR